MSLHIHFPKQKFAYLNFREDHMRQKRQNMGGKISNGQANSNSDEMIQEASMDGVEVSDASAMNEQVLRPKKVFVTLEQVLANFN